MPVIQRSTAAITVVCLAGLAAGCVSVTAGTSPPSATALSRVESAAPHYRPIGSTDAWLVVGRTGEDALHVIRASNQEHMADLPLGAPDDAWATMVAASTADGSTLVRELEVDSDAPGRSQSVDGAWRLPTVGLDPLPVGVSADGQTIVLVEAGGPALPGTSRFAILSRTFAAPPRIVELRGQFEYDALSPDGSTLYVVEHLPTPPEGHYQVRAVDTASGTLRDGVVVDKRAVDEAMAGYPIAQLRRADGMVFTLYRGVEHPFIHALSSVDGWALCIDLPATGADDAAAALDWGLTGSADGTIYAVNATLGLAAEVDASDLSVARSVRFDAPAATGITLAKFGHEPGGPVGRRVVVSADGTTIYAAGSGGIARLETGRLDARTLLDGSAIDALALTPDGGTLYALLHQGGRIVALDTATGEALRAVPGAGYDRLVAVVPW